MLAHACIPRRHVPFLVKPSRNGLNALLLEGLSNKAIASELMLSVRTVESHVSHSLAKTGCRSRLELVIWLMTHTPMQS